MKRLIISLLGLAAVFTTGYEVSAKSCIRTQKPAAVTTTSPAPTTSVATEAPATTASVASVASEAPTNVASEASAPTTSVVLEASATQQTAPVFEAKLDGIYMNGAKFTFKGANYFGTEALLVPDGLWGGGGSTTLQKIATFLKNNNFNAVRLPLAVDAVLQNLAVDKTKIVNEVALLNTFNGKTLSYLDVLDYVIEVFATNKILIVLDAHLLTHTGSIGELWYSSDSDKNNFADAWKILANRYKNTWNVVAADLKNEPHGQATWGSGDKATDFRLAALQWATSIQAIVPRWLIFVEGISQSSRDVASFPTFWGENLMDVQRAHFTLPVAERLVYSPHVYGPDVSAQPYFSNSTFPANMPAIWDLHFGFIQKKYGPLVVGEWGGKYLSSADEKWQQKFAAYLQQKSIGFFYWCVNPNSGDTGGLLEDDWTTPRSDKLKLLSAFKGTAIP